MRLSASRALAWGGHRTSRRLEAQRGEGWQPQVGGVAGGGARVKAEGEMGRQCVPPAGSVNMWGSSGCCRKIP